MVKAYIVDNNNHILQNLNWGSYSKVTAANFDGYTNYQISGYWSTLSPACLLRLDVLDLTGNTISLISEPVCVKLKDMIVLCSMISSIAQEHYVMQLAPCMKQAQNQ